MLNYSKKHRYLYKGEKSVYSNKRNTRHELIVFITNKLFFPVTTNSQATIKTTLSSCHKGTTTTKSPEFQPSLRIQAFNFHRLFINKVTILSILSLETRRHWISRLKIRRSLVFTTFNRIDKLVENCYSYDMLHFSINESS